MTQHRVEFIDDLEMPDDLDWLLVETGETVVFALRRSQATSQLLEEAWSSYKDDLAS